MTSGLSGKRIFVATELNVLAAVNAHDGSIGKSKSPFMNFCYIFNSSIGIAKE